MINKITNSLSKLILLAFFTLLFTACGEEAEENKSPEFTKSQQGQIKVAILGTNDFFPDRAVQQQMGLPEALAARVIENLQKSNRFIVLERTALRKIINEQQFGLDGKDSFLDRTLNAAIEELPDVSGYAVKWTGLLADHNDIVKEYQDLGTTMGADYLVFAVLEKADEKITRTAIPYSQSDKTISKHVSDARLRLRVINTATGRIAGTASFRTKVSESVFEGRESKQDEYSTYDHVGALAAHKILDIVSPAKIVSVDPLAINRGSNDAYTVGSIFKVSREGKEVKDPTGVVIGHIKTPAGSIKLASVQDTLSVVEIVDGNIQLGDLLELENQAQAIAGKADQTVEKTSKAGKLTLAIGKVHFNLIGDNIILLADDYPRIKNDLLVKLTNTNRFDLLERHEVDQVLDEKNFTALMAGDEIDPYLKEMIGADYLVLSAVDKFTVKQENKKVAYVDEIQTRHYGIVEATLRIVDSHSGKILAADKIRINKKLDKFNNNLSANVYGDLIDELTSTMVSKIVHRLYPIKVMAVTAEGTVYINRGQDGGLQAGEMFDLMRPGEALIDPDTGISFGTAENKVAQLRLVNIEASRATANIVSGTDVQRGDILRKAQQAVTQRPKTKVNRPNF